MSISIIPHSKHWRRSKTCLPQVGMQPYSVASHLMIYGVVLSLPLILLLGALLYRSAALERQELEARMQQLADDLVDDLDRDLERRIITLRTLAASPSLQANDLATFHVHAKAAVAGWGIGIFLIGRE